MYQNNINIILAVTFYKGNVYIQHVTSVLNGNKQQHNLDKNIIMLPEAAVQICDKVVLVAVLYNSY